MRETGDGFSFSGCLDEQTDVRRRTAGRGMRRRRSHECRGGADGADGSDKLDLAEHAF